MSQWTHIRGGFELISTPYELKGKKNTKYGSKDVYLPFPEEQMKVLAPLPSYYYKEGAKPQLDFKAYIFSLPRARKYIEKAFKLLPQGESGWAYSIGQNISQYSSSSSTFHHLCDEKAFKNAITKMYQCDDEWESRDYKDLSKNIDIDLSWVDHVNGITIGVREDIRDCSGEEMLEGLEKFFKYLYENDIYVEDGYLEWEDEYLTWNENNHYYYTFRKSRISDDYDVRFEFSKVDYDTNKILWKKTYKLPTITEVDENGEERKKFDYQTKNLEVVETYLNKEELENEQ